MIEKCQRCQDEGEDRRALKMSCGYDMNEIGIPFGMHEIEQPNHSVRYKLPLYKQCILFYSTDDNVQVSFGCYRGKDEKGIDWFTDYAGFTPFKDSVTHWMSLPEVPR